MWPYATSVTLTAVANVLTDARLGLSVRPIVHYMTAHEIDYGVEADGIMRETFHKRNLIEVKEAEKNKDDEVDKIEDKNDDSDDDVEEKKSTASITKEDYFRILRQYAMSHTRVREKGEKGYKEVEGESDKDVNRIFWLDENLDPATGKSYRICRVYRILQHLFCRNCMIIQAYVCVCTYTCLCVCMYVYMYVCVYLCMHVCMYVCMCVRKYECMYVCMYVYMYVYMYVCMYVCVYECMYVCMYECMYV